MDIHWNHITERMTDISQHIKQQRIDHLEYSISNTDILIKNAPLKATYSLSRISNKINMLPHLYGKG